MRNLARLLALLPLFVAFNAEANWNSISQTLIEQDVYAVVAYGQAPATPLYAGFKGSVRSSEDGGRSWKLRLKLRSSSSRALCFVSDPKNSQTIYAGTDEGLYRSTDAGKKWEKIYQHADESHERVCAVAVDRRRLSRILIGTQSGLLVSEDSGASWTPEPFFEGQNIYQIEALPDGGFLAASSKGLYRDGLDSSGWVELYRTARSGESDDSQAAAEDAAEFEISGISLYFWRPENDAVPIVLFYGKQVLLSIDAGQTWKSGDLPALPLGLAAAPAGFSESGDLLLLPTEKGIYILDRRSMTVTSASWGLPTSGVRKVFYDKNRDSAFAATDRGLFLVDHPETMITLRINNDNVRIKNGEILKYFENEPSIQDLQSIAMRYAEVHPEKIAEWRAAAARKAFLPTLSIGQDVGSDQTVDIDRGGTADPDKFIFGPNEGDTNFSVDVSWDLADLIWNNDQTSIDNRSKLMVQLRDDILSQLTHLYFARRRLQIQTVLASHEPPAAMIERELQIQEYTAGIDALTGGYLTKKLREDASDKPGGANGLYGSEGERMDAAIGIP